MTPVGINRVGHISSSSFLPHIYSSPYLSLLPSFLSYSFYLFLTLFLFSMYVCIYLHSLSHPHHRFYMYVLLLSVCLPSLYPFYLSPFFIPSSSSSSFFYVCMYIFIFYLIFYFWTDLGNVCHYNKYMEKFLTIQSSIYLQTNSKNIFSLFFYFLFLFIYLFFFNPFFLFLTHFRNIRPSHNSIEQFLTIPCSIYLQTK